MEKRVHAALTLLVVAGCASSSSNQAAGFGATCVPPGFENARRLTTEAVAAPYADQARHQLEDPARYLPPSAGREGYDVPVSLTGVNALARAELFISESGTVSAVCYQHGDQRWFRYVAKNAAFWKFRSPSGKGSVGPFILPLTFALSDWRFSPADALNDRTYRMWIPDYDHGHYTPPIIWPSWYEPAAIAGSR
jgi:hypothetical protein